MVHNKNRRRFSRIDIQGAASLDFGLKKYKRHVDNVSLSGCHVHGFTDQAIGDLCIIKLKPSGGDIYPVIHAVGTISRRTDDGSAIEFLSMKLESFRALQTSLLYNSDDPCTLGEEFVDNNIYELAISNDLIFFKPCK